MSIIPLNIKKTDTDWKHKTLDRIGSRHMNSVSVQKTWPSTRKDILESNEFLNLDNCLFNLIAWTVSANAAMGKESFFGLSYRKARKVSEIAQNIKYLFSGAQSGLNQMPVSITMLKQGHSW